ncbi:hypothetical protein MNB_SUP05-SYMBIONT-4-325 [hydrothermal vent metagenome]|uniref:Uncharacterized protein n=1 Tax=hydrothermal vent metagenome TaxID=652676 RepID=A0A1W1DYR9_9ZZZZ
MTKADIIEYKRVFLLENKTLPTPIVADGLILLLIFFTPN